MSYEVPTDSAEFRLTGAPYVVASSAVADFAFDGKALVYFAPPPGLIRPFESRWQTGTDRQLVHITGYGSSRPINTSRTQTSQQASPVETLPFGLFWGAVTKKETMVSFSHGQSQRKEAITGDQWQQPEQKDTHKQGIWDKSIEAQDQEQALPWNHPPERDSKLKEGMQSVDLYGASQRISKAYPLPQPPLSFVFQDREYRPQANGSVFFQIGQFDENIAAQPADSKRTFSHQSNRAEDQPVILPWGFGQKARDETVTGNYGGEKNPDIVEKPEPEQPEIRESYLLMNIVTTVVLPDRTPLELPSLEISLDIDSFSWSMTGQLWGASNIALVEPDQNGPKQIEVDINGWKWVFIIERYSTDRRFGDERYTIYGSSRTQLLAAPYAPVRSKSNSSGLNAKQAITEELANTGFVAAYPDLNDYSTPDWIMPGGSFSYQNQTAMQIVAKIATTAGSVIIPSRDDDQVSIQPRYPASPWAWITATMDRIVPASMVISLSANWRPEQDYNAVYVSGTNAGVAVNVKRTGSNGDNPAPDILEDWLTATQVNTERGRNELAKGGNQSITTIEIPLTDTNTAPGLIEPGMLVEVLDITGDWQGLCLATSISASSVGTVVQSVDLERHFETSSAIPQAPANADETDNKAVVTEPTEPTEPALINMIEAEGQAANDWSNWDHWGNSYYWGSGTTQQQGTVNGALCMIGTGTNTKNNGTFLYHYRTYAFEAGKSYTFSIWLRADVDTEPNITSYINSYLGGSQHEVMSSRTTKAATQIKSAWTQFVWTFSCNEDTPPDEGGIAIALNKQPPDAAIYWAMPILVEGDVEPEEIQSAWTYNS